MAHAGDAERLARRRAQRRASRAVPRDPRARDELRRHLRRRRRRATGEMRSNVISSQGVHDRYGGVVPEVASRHHLELVNDVVDDALRRAGVRSTTSSSSRSPRGPGSSARCSWAWPRPRGWPPARGLPLAPVDHLQGHVAANFLGGAPFEPPFLCLIASGGHTFLARVEDHAGFAVLGRTLDDAAGEAFDKGARMLGPALSRRPGARAPGRRGRPRRLRLPDRRAACRAWTSPSPGSRRRCSTRCATWARRRGAGGPTSPRPTSTRSSRRWRVRVERALRETGPAAAGDRRRRGRQRAAARADGRPRRRAARPRARAVHRQRGDDRAPPRAG